MSDRLAQAVEAQTEVLKELRDLLRLSMTPQAGCDHPDGLRRDLSTMGDKWIQCGGCGADLVRETTRS